MNAHYGLWQRECDLNTRVMVSKTIALTAWLSRYIPDGQFQVMPSTILERRATTRTLAASCNGWWKTSVLPRYSDSQSPCVTVTLRSPFGGWVIYPLTSHSSLVAGAADSFPCATIRQVLPLDIMYCTIAPSPCQYLFQNFLKHFSHTTYQKI